MTDLYVKRLEPEAYLPTKAYTDDAAFDLYALEDTVILPGWENTAKVRTGVSFELPQRMALLILPRSSTGLNTPLRIANAPGLVDPGYRGEIVILTTNIGTEPWKVEASTRIAQALPIPSMYARLFEVEQLSASERSSSGFGSSGR